MYCMGRMEKYWDRPLEFLPERWLDPEKNKERHPFLFIPFQGTRTAGLHHLFAPSTHSSLPFQLDPAPAWGRTWPISKPR
jgi:cytochrome P450